MAWTPPDSDTIVEAATQGWQPPATDTVVKPVQPLPLYAQRLEPTVNAQPQPSAHTLNEYAPSIGPTPFLTKLGGKATALENKLFPGTAEKGSPSPMAVTSAASMLVPLGLPERLGKMVAGYFTAKTLYDQKAVKDQLSQELKSGNYSEAEKTAVNDALNLGMVGAMAGGMHSGPETLDVVPGVSGRIPVTGKSLLMPSGAIPEPFEIPESQRIPSQGIPFSGIPERDLQKPKATKVTVPGTPSQPEPRNVIQEIRQRGLNTRAKILDAFPSATKEQAQQLWRQAWPEIVQANKPQTIEQAVSQAVTKFNAEKELEALEAKLPRGLTLPEHERLQQLLYQTSHAIPSEELPVEHSKATTGDILPKQPFKPSTPPVRPFVPPQPSKPPISQSGALTKGSGLTPEEEAEEQARLQAELTKPAKPQGFPLDVKQQQKLETAKIVPRTILKDLGKDEGFTYDGDMSVGASKLHQFTFRNLPKDDPALGATFYAKPSDTPEQILAKARAKAKEFRDAAKPPTTLLTDKPLASKGLKSYRYKGKMGWIMIGAKDNADAISEANRSLEIPNATVKNLQIWDGRKYKPVAQLPKEPISRGPGAAASGEPGTYSPIQHLADQLRTASKPGEPINSQVTAIEKAKAALGAASDTLQSHAAAAKAIGNAIWDKWTGLPEYGDEQRAVGKWFYAIQRADYEARQFARSIVKEVPNKLRREAITNWIQADGNANLLRQRADASKPRWKPGYEAALNLSPREIEIAKMLRDYYDIQLERGQDAGIIRNQVENYITQVWKRENPITKKLLNDLSYVKLTPNFKYAKKRIFDSFFEGEQAGYIPNKDAGFLVANYDQVFNKTLAARAFIKDLHEGKASDGRPLVEISGNGKVIEGDEGKGAVLVTPYSKPEDLADYRTIDHPALRGWKWATKTPEGQNVFVKGDMLVHPEAYQKLKNRLSVSAFRQSPVGRAFLGAQTAIKQTMLSVSGFHQVQETLHALGHRVNPMNLSEIDFSDPTTKDLVTHGLQLADYDALSSFGEGLTGGGLTTKVPFVGKYLHAYNEFLFQDYIPRLKLQMAKLALERNRERYPGLNEDKLLEQTARQANSAFGELPLKYWGRNPTFQDAMRAFFLAPDFLEARGRFVGRAVRPYGREQLMALGLLAATQYITARIINQIVDNDPHWEWKNAFRIVIGQHAYGLRTIPSDLIHLFSDTRGFFYNRFSPLLRTASEAMTGRDDKGVKRSIMEQVKDMIEMPIPIGIKPRMGERWWEPFLNSFGLQEQRYDAVQDIQQRVARFKASIGIKDPYETVYDVNADKYAPLKYAIEDNDAAKAKEEFTKLSKTIPAYEILKHFRLSLNRPFTGSRVNDVVFESTLDEAGITELAEARKLNQQRLQLVESLER